MRRLLDFVIRLPRLLLLGSVRAYQHILGPHVPSSCRYAPSCSEYAAQALKKYGAMKGFVLAAHRILRCHPWGGQGYDPPTWYGENDEVETT